MKKRLLLALTCISLMVSSVMTVTASATNVDAMNQTLNDLTTRQKQIEIGNTTYIWGKIVSESPFIVLCPLAVSTDNVLATISAKYHKIENPNTDWIKGSSYAGYHSYRKTEYSKTFDQDIAVYDTATAQQIAYGDLQNEIDALKEKLEIEKLEISGKKTINYENGRKYVGPVNSKNQPHGQGTLSGKYYTYMGYTDGLIYEGQFTDGQMTGYGTRYYDLLKTDAETGVFRNGEMIDAISTFGNKVLLDTHDVAAKLYVGVPCVASSYDDIFEIDSPPVVINSSTYVPIRAIIEAVDGSADWDSKTRTATICQFDNKLEFQLDSDIAVMNGQVISMPVKALSINGRTMVPIRFISESLGYIVKWDANEKSISIIEPEAITRKRIKATKIEVITWIDNDEYETNVVKTVFEESKFLVGNTYDYVNEMNALIEKTLHGVRAKTLTQYEQAIRERLMSISEFEGNIPEIQITAKEKTSYDMSPSEISAPTISLAGDKVYLSLGLDEETVELVKEYNYYSDYVAIEGTVKDEYMDNLRFTINGRQIDEEEYTIKKGVLVFEVYVNLTPGENIFELYAENKTGKGSSRRITIYNNDGN